MLIHIEIKMSLLENNLLQKKLLLHQRSLLVDNLIFKNILKGGHRVVFLENFSTPFSNLYF